MTVEFIQPTSWDEALAAKSAFPAGMPIAGGTDVMVELNFDRARPEALIDLTRVGELREWEEDEGILRIGAGVSYTRVITELGERLPGLAMAARTIGSPQIRNRGTVGGNLGAASPAGDSHPPLVAAHAEVELASSRGTRHVPVREFYAGPKQNVVADDELIAAILVAPSTGAEQFSKIGARNGDGDRGVLLRARDRPRGAARRHRDRVGRADAPAAREAEDFLEGVLGESDGWDLPVALGEPVVERFGELVAAAARPIDDVRSSAAYRREALRVLARRTLTWARGIA